MCMCMKGFSMEAGQDKGPYSRPGVQSMSSGAIDFVVVWNAKSFSLCFYLQLSLYL